MRKLLLSSFAMFTTVCMFAQTGSVTTPRLLSKPNYRTIEQNALNRTSTNLPTPISNPNRGTSRAISSTLLGSAGNAYGSIQSGCNQISYNSATNQVIFIHRTNKFLYPGDDANNGQYRYDVSRDGGTTWTINRGTLNPSGSEAGFACRYPQATMYNPTGNTDPDSSYITYFGSFHSGGTAADWQGYPTGRARLDNSPSTFTERKYTPNSSNTGISTSLIQSAPGVYWAVDEYVVATDGTDPEGISVYKGVWNSDSNSVIWTAQPVIYPPLDNNADGKRHINSASIAFDPTGQFGWIAASSDVTNDGEGTFDPIFYKTTDGGATWSSMIRLDLDSINGITFDATNGPASTTFELGLTVDVNGNPHLGVIVIAGSTTTPFSIVGNAPDKFLYDITFNPTLSADCQWKANKLEYVNSLRKDIGDVSLDNYIKASRSEDGTKIFFSWVDSDSNIITVGPNGDNLFPDFKMIGIDVVNNLKTATKNFTVGDAIWGGDVLWPQTSPLARLSTGTYNIPTVFVKLNAALSDVDTTYFHYVSNINFTTSEFSLQLDNQAPDISLTGDSLVWIPVSTTPYNDPGAIAFDCVDGNLSSSINVVTTVVENTPGTYSIVYTVTDAAGNSSSITRIVKVSNAPNCDNTIVPTTPGRFNFQYTNPGTLATSWTWRYSSTAGSGVTTNGNISYKYPTNGTYQVIFCATNPIGTCCDTTTLDVINISVEDFNLDENISAYPNPVNNLLNISIDLNNSMNTEIKLLNLVGEEVYSKNIGTVNGITNEIIDVSSYQDGMYILKIQTDKGVATKKININK